MSQTTRLHGLEINLPEASFEDVSIYRFLHADKGVGPVLLAKQPEALQPNLVITREADDTGASLPRFLESIARERTAKNASFKVLGSGMTKYLEQDVAWLDTSEVVGEGLRAFQRYIAARPSKGSIALMTMTGTEQQLRSMLKSIGFV
jgi:hypothetical protein